MIRSRGQGDRISLYRIDRQGNAQVAQQVWAEDAQRQYEGVGKNRALAGCYGSDTAAFSLDASDLCLHLQLGPAFYAALCQ